MKILTWNMDHWKRNVEQRPASWKYLIEVLDPDVALLQEAVPPETLYDSSHVLYHEIDGYRKWGVATVSKLPFRREIFVNRGTRGASGVIVAEMRTGDGQLLTLINVYGLLDCDHYATTTMHHVLSDLTIILDDRQRNIVLAGDLNVSEQYDEKYKGRFASHKLVFDRLEDFGLVNCTRKHCHGYVRTLVHAKSDFEWQNDYIFVSERLDERVTACEVVAGEGALDRSDHYTVMITVEA